jgi:TRAP-type mannitol/chloroaromatic compound transport system permease large subunit
MSLTVGISFVIAVVSKVLRLRLLSVLAEQVIFVMVPPLALIFLVLGTIFIGVATPTEGGAMGAVGAMALAIMKGRLRLDLVRQAAESTAKLSAFVVFILIGARAFFLDFFEIAFIVIPLLAGPADKLGIDLIWFGVVLGVNMQTSFMHPPFGFALFYLRSVAPREPYLDRITGKRMEPVTTGQIYWGAVPYVIIQCIMVALVIAFPAMVMHYKSVGTGIDPDKVRIDIPQTEDLPPLNLDIAPPKIQ